MAFDDGDKSFIKLAVMEGFQQHKELDHKPLETKVDKLDKKIATWAGGLAVIVLLVGWFIEANNGKTTQTFNTTSVTASTPASSRP